MDGSDAHCATVATAREVRGPLSLSASQWWCVLKGVNATSQRVNLALIAAGVAFFGLMAVIPGVAALVALLGLLGDPNLIDGLLEALGGIAPDAVVAIIAAQVQRLLEARSDALLLGTLFNLALSLWSALQGTRVLLMALTLVNRRAEERSFLRRYVTAGVFTLYGLGLSILTVLTIGVVPVALSMMHAETGVETLLLAVRWPVLAAATIVLSFILYRWGPRRRPPPWRWLWPGAVGAPVAWVLASSAFTFALREFPNFGAAYGSLASVVALLLWLYLTAQIFLFGGALNAELEFFSVGKPAVKLKKNERIESPVSVSGGKKETTRPVPIEPPSKTANG